MPRGRRQNTQPARLQEALVLHKYILSLLGCKDLEALSRDLKDPALEGVDDEGVSRLYYVLTIPMRLMRRDQRKFNGSTISIWPCCLQKSILTATLLTGRICGRASTPF